MKRPQFLCCMQWVLCIVCALHACLLKESMVALHCMSALHACLLKESMVVLFSAMFRALMTFCIFGWVRSRSLRLVRLHRFCSQVGQVLITQLLVESPPPSHVCWAQSQMGSAAELHLAVIIIMMLKGGPRYCFD